jgi:3-oxoacyl-[acyl-carrier-protein] synthase III
MEDFRQAAKQARDKIAAANGGSPQKAVDVLQGMGVTSLADVPEDQRQAVLDALNAAAEG